MFDVGFSEILLVGLVSLLVIGPQKLPHVARIVGFWLGKTRTMVASVKEEIKTEFHAEEMRQLLNQQAAMLEKMNAKATEIGAEAQLIKTDFLNSLSATTPSLLDDAQNTLVPSVVSESNKLLTPQQVPLEPSPPPVPVKRPKFKRRRHGKK